jgi:hypothetical protein
MNKAAICDLQVVGNECTITLAYPNHASAAAACGALRQQAEELQRIVIPIGSPLPLLLPKQPLDQ